MLKTIVLPSTVNNILAYAFGDISSLKTVTFKKKLDDQGNIVVPNISNQAFIKCGSASNPVTIRVPWSQDQTPDAPWGANAIVEYDYEEIE